MDNQDTKFNYKIILAALCAVILGILIAFYFSYAQSQSEITYLEDQKELLVKDLTLMKADVDRLSALDEMNDIELQSSRYRIQQLIDSIGKLNFTVSKLREYKGELRILAAKNDSLELKNDFLKYNNDLLANKYQASQRQVEELQRTFSALTSAESAQKRQMKEVYEELKTKTYLEIYNATGSALRSRAGKLIQSNKASTISKLKGTVVIDANPSLAGQKRILYLQFLSPIIGVIEDNANTIIVNGNPYSKRLEVDFDGKLMEVTGSITVPEGSLSEGNYTLNVFEDNRLLESVEFQLK